VGGGAGFKKKSRSRSFARSGGYMRWASDRGTISKRGAEGDGTGERWGYWESGIMLIVDLCKSRVM